MAELTCPHWEHVAPHECSQCSAAQVTAAYQHHRAGRPRYVVVVRRGAVSRHVDTRQLAEAWRWLDAYPHHPDLIVRLPPKETP